MVPDDPLLRHAHPLPQGHRALADPWALRAFVVGRTVVVCAARAIGAALVAVRGRGGLVPGPRLEHLMALGGDQPRLGPLGPRVPAAGRGAQAGQDRAVGIDPPGHRRLQIINIRPILWGLRGRGEPTHSSGASQQGAVVLIICSPVRHGDVKGDGAQVLVASSCWRILVPAPGGGAGSPGSPAARAHRATGELQEGVLVLHTQLVPR
mmetsp:Transcript_121171/g.277690  ORF Transcript_121171/g.277690 Transcript_121171/m.277690 type:complete len:208 (+) Transcript_121171:624-1247(+)